jgi:hypothetical protein
MTTDPVSNARAAIHTSLIGRSVPDVLMRNRDLFDRPDALLDRWVGIAQGDVERMRREVGEVVGGKLLESADESGLVMGRLDREAIRFALMAAGNPVQ